MTKMKVLFGGYAWEPGDADIERLSALKKRIAQYLETHAATSRYKLDNPVRTEAEKWTRDCHLPAETLEIYPGSTVTIHDDPIDFPFELLAQNGAFLGETYAVYRHTTAPYKPRRDYKMFYRFETGDHGYRYYEHLEKNFPLQLLQPAGNNTSNTKKGIDGNVLHVCGHFQPEEKQDILDSATQGTGNPLLFFNSCATIKLNGAHISRHLSHYILSYFDIPLDTPAAVEDFPFTFYRLLLEGHPPAAAFRGARVRSMAQTGRITPLLFTLFTSAPETPVFHTPYAGHHKDIEKRIAYTYTESGGRELKDERKFPPFLFLTHAPGDKRQTLQAWINSSAGHTWIYGPRAGIGKTTLLYQLFRLFQYGKFSGPLLIAPGDDPGFRESPGETPGQYLSRCLGLRHLPPQRKETRPHLVLVDAVEEDTFLYRHFFVLVEELQGLLGPCRVIAASRHRCPVPGFSELAMEISPGDINAQRLRARYHIGQNVKLPDLPLAYRFYSGAGGPPQQGTITKSSIFTAFIRRYQEKAAAGNHFIMMPETFQRYLALLAHRRFQNRGAPVTRRQFHRRLRCFKQDHPDDTDWWLYDGERKHYRDAESVCRLLLSTHIIVSSGDFLLFVHHSFYEYLLAYYFAWMGMDPPDIPLLPPLMYTEVPDYMKELAAPGNYAGNHPPPYLQLVFDRLFYIRDYKNIETILSNRENQSMIKASPPLWYCLVKGCYFARNPGKHIDEVRAFRFVNQFTTPHSLLDPANLEPGNRSLLETCYALLNMLFDNNLLEEFFRFAFYLKETCPALEVYGLLSRGFLKIRHREKASAYLELKEQAIGAHPEKEKHRVRMYAEKGLLYFIQYLEHREGEIFRRGTEQLALAETYYRRDKREEWNYLFTLREMARFYLEAGQPGAFEEVMEKIRAIPIEDHPKTDYVPYLEGRKRVRLDRDVGAGIVLLLEGAGGFYRKQLLFESAQVYLWAYLYEPGEEKRRLYLEEARRLLVQADEKREQIKNQWNNFDAHLKHLYTLPPPSFEDPGNRLIHFANSPESANPETLHKFLQEHPLIT